MAEHFHEFDLKKSLRTSLRWLVAVYVLVFLLVLFIADSFNHLHHQRLANVLTLSARHSLISRDLRQAITTLHPSVEDSFASISFTTRNGSQEIALPTASAVAAEESFPISRTVEIPVMSMTSTHVNGEIVGTLRFNYRRSLAIYISLGLWLFFLVLAIPIFSAIRRLIERRHHEIVAGREATLLGNLAQQVSHDIRSPLSALNFALRNLEEIPDANRSLIRSASSRINEIANDLLERYKANRSNFTSTEERVDLNEFTASAAVSIGKLVREVYEEKKIQLCDRTNIRLDLDVAVGEDVRAILNRKEFSRALSNLIDNAEEGLDERGTITLAVRSSVKTVSVIVSDDGRGIPETVVSRLGKERISYGKSGKASSSGIGLLHARQSAEAVGGRFAVQSRIGEGTIVTMIFPKCVLSIPSDGPQQRSPLDN